MNKYMKSAYNQAVKAYENDEVPVGCVIVQNGKIIARSYNKKESNNDPFGHAEIIAIKKACKKLNKWRLNDCEIYVTMEPCAMCLSALIQSRIKEVNYGCIDSRFGAIEGAFNLLECGKFNHAPKTNNLSTTECGDILSKYFKNKRIVSK